MTEENSVKITYETLFEILRTEKSREELQKLDEVFFSNVVAYLKDKRGIVEKNKDNTSLFSVSEKGNTEQQLINIKKIIKEIYERREQKIIKMALNKSITNSNIVDTANMQVEEKNMFDEAVELFNKFRKGVLHNVLQETNPSVEKQEIKKVIEPKKDDVNGFITAEQRHAENAHKESENAEPALSDNSKPTKLVRFLSPVPKFLGKELENYGPFEEEDMASLPSQIANVLVEKKRAEEIKEN